MFNLKGWRSALTRLFSSTGSNRRLYELEGSIAKPVIDQLIKWPGQTRLAGRAHPGD